MPATLRRIESPFARRCAQICVVSLAAFVSSGLGLLTYLTAYAAPAWLESIVMVSGAVSLLSFTGWLVASLSSLARSYHS
jgi:hypothetical protein